MKIVIIAYHIDIPAIRDIISAVIFMKESFRYYTKAENVIFKYALGPSDETGKEFHEFHEIILFLGGEAELICETLRTKLTPGTVLLIPRETYHQVQITGRQEDYLRCTISFFRLSPALCLPAQVCLLDNEPEVMFLFRKLIKSAYHPTYLAATELEAALALILCRLLSDCTPYNPHAGQSTRISSVIAYINKNIGRELSLKEIAHCNHLSESSLSHLFKKELRISVYQYILKKRLSLARQKINAGVPAMTAAAECGFKDYSGFYRQYKKAFHRAPSERFFSNKTEGDYLVPNN